MSLLAKGAILLCLAVLGAARGLVNSTVPFNGTAVYHPPIPLEENRNTKSRDPYVKEADPDVYAALTASGNPDAISGMWANANNSVVLNLPRFSEKKTVEQINKEAPSVNITTQSGVVAAKPLLRQFTHEKNGTVVKDGLVHSASVDPSEAPVQHSAASQNAKVQAKSLTGSAAASKALVPAKGAANGKSGPVKANVLGNIEQILGQIPNTPGSGIGITGGQLELLVGVRVSTPFFGFGFNFCLARWISSWPKVGIVIPNPVAWLLPEFVDLAGDLQTTLQLPAAGATAPLGARISPTSDGFLIWLPSVQPQQISEFGFRYGVQIAQLFGVDFGFGWQFNNCAIDFVRV